MIYSLTKEIEKEKNVRGESVYKTLAVHNPHGLSVCFGFSVCALWNEERANN